MYKDDEIDTLLNKFFQLPDPQCRNELIALYNKLATLNDIPIVRDKSKSKVNLLDIANMIRSLNAIHNFQTSSLSVLDNQEEEQKLASFLYTKHWKEFFELAQVEITVQKESNDPTANSSLILFNNDGYVSEDEHSNADYYIKAQPIALDNNTPIGYVINLPPGEVKGIQIEVYGGTQKDDSNTMINKPGSNLDEAKALLAKGIAVVKLNLVDLKELDVFQMQMPEDLHTRLHQSINTFWETIKNNPESLSPELEALKNKPIVLRGDSFGGRTALRHAQLYPHTFDGYISFDGAIAGDALHYSDSDKVTRGLLQEHLDPVLHIDDLQDPVLLIHNANDNNVNVKVSLEFYNQAKEHGKEHLCAMHINRKGSPYEHVRGAHNTGHFAPLAKDIQFGNQINCIDNFIRSGLDDSPALTQWRGINYNVASSRNFKNATAEERFIEYVMREYRQKLPPVRDLEMIYGVFQYVDNCSTDREYLDVIRNSQSKQECEQAVRVLKPKIENYLKEKLNAKIDIDPMNRTLLKAYGKSLKALDPHKHRELLLNHILSNPELVYSTAKEVVMNDPNIRDKAELAIKHLYQHRTKMRAASKMLLKNVVSRQVKSEQAINEKIRQGDLDQFIALIKEYSKHKYNKTFESRCQDILGPIDKDTRQPLLMNVCKAIIGDDFVESNMIDFLLNQLTLEKQHLVMLSESEKINRKLQSPFVSKDYFQLIYQRSSTLPKEQKQQLFCNSGHIKHIQTIEEFDNYFSGFKPDEIVEVYQQTDPFGSALALRKPKAFHEHLKIVIGEESYKQLLFVKRDNFNIPLLEYYLGDIDMFQYLLSRYEPQYLLEHLNNRPYDDDTDMNILYKSIENRHYEAYTTMLDYLQNNHCDSKTIKDYITGYDYYEICSCLSMLIRNFCENASNECKVALEQTIDLYSADELVSALKHPQINFAELYQRSYVESDQFILDKVKSKLSETQFKNVLNYHAKLIISAMMSSENQSLNDNVINDFGQPFVHELVNRELPIMVKGDSLTKLRSYIDESQNTQFVSLVAEQFHRLFPDKCKETTIQKYLSCIKSEEYDYFSEQFNTSNEFLVKVCDVLNDLKSEDNQRVIKQMFSVNDALLPYILPFDFLKELISNKPSILPIIEQDFPKGPYGEIVKEILNRNDSKLIELITNTSPETMQAALENASAEKQRFILAVMQSSPVDVSLLMPNPVHSVADDMSQTSQDSRRSQLSQFIRESKQPSSILSALLPTASNPNVSPQELIQRVFENDPSVYFLALDKDDLQPAHVNQLGDALKSSKHLLGLDLSGSDLHESEAFLQGLKDNTSLQYLVLSSSSSSESYLKKIYEICEDKNIEVDFVQPKAELPSKKGLR